MILYDCDWLEHSKDPVENDVDWPSGAVQLKRGGVSKSWLCMDARVRDLDSYYLVRYSQGLYLYSR